MCPDWPYPYDAQAYIMVCTANVCFDPKVPETGQVVYPPEQFILAHIMEKRTKHNM